MCAWSRGLQKRHPVFIAYLLFVSVEQFSLFILDISPKVSGETWWACFWVGMIVEGLLKFGVIAELAHKLLTRWPAVARLGRNAISIAGVLLVFIAAIAAAHAAPENSPWFIGSAHILSQTLYLTEAGLILSLFVVATILKVPWDRITFGIALGFGILWCEHLAVWALVAGGVDRDAWWQDFGNMATYHVCVLIWAYFLLVSKKVQTQTPGLPPPEKPEVWNREMERLLHS